MTLADYLNSRDIRLTDFAATLGIGVSTLHGYVSGRRRPSVGALAKIEKATEGSVRAADFVPDAPQIESAQNAAA